LNVVPRKANAKASLDALPLTIGTFTGVEVPVEPKIKDILETRNVILRDYMGPNGVRVSLAIVYYDQYRVHFHMPDGCMVGKGTIVTAHERESLGVLEGGRESITVNKLALKQPEAREHVFYFFTTGDLITASYTKMRIHLMMSHLKRRHAGAALVRFSVRTDENNEEMALKTIKDFIKQTAVILPSYLS
jgi:EpsI family protein